MKHRLLVTVAGAAALAGTTPAFAIDYNYVEPRYTVSGDVADIGDVTGFGIEASLLFNDWVYGRASGDFYGIDTGDESDQTLDLYSIGPGIRVPVTAGQYPIDLYGQLNYQRVATGSVETGISAVVGGAMDITDDLEGRVELTTMDDDDVELDLYEARVAYDVNEEWAVIGSFLTGDAEVSDSDADPEGLVRLGVRFNF